MSDQRTGGRTSRSGGISGRNRRRGGRRSHPGFLCEQSRPVVAGEPALLQCDDARPVRRQGIDEVVTPFGIRSLAWSAEQGFRLNGKPIKFAGGSVHHDNGPLGAAAFDRAEERKVELLKAAGLWLIWCCSTQIHSQTSQMCDLSGLLCSEVSCWTGRRSTRFLNRRGPPPHRGHSLM